LVAYLAMLWQEGVEHNMLRVAIISALVSSIFFNELFQFNFL
jgi:hypothetical protein